MFLQHLSKASWFIKSFFTFFHIPCKIFNWAIHWNLTWECESMLLYNCTSLYVMVKCLLYFYSCSMSKIVPKANFSMNYIFWRLNFWLRNTTPIDLVDSKRLCFIYKMIFYLESLQFIYWALSSSLPSLQLNYFLFLYWITLRFPALFVVTVKDIYLKICRIINNNIN